MLTENKSKYFSNGSVYALKTEDGYPIEVTDTFLPYYTKDASHQSNNSLQDFNLGSRAERWMIGVSCMSGCPVGCKFCATAKLSKWRSLSAQEIFEQVMFIVEKNKISPKDSMEFKINYTRMGEPFLNIDAVRGAIEMIDELFPNTHHYISTIGVIGSDFSWIKDNITLQISLHSLDEQRRDWLIPTKKMSIQQLGEIRTCSWLKTTLNMTLVDEQDFDVETLKQNFDPEKFFIKLSPINKNETCDENLIGDGIIFTKNLI